MEKSTSKKKEKKRQTENEKKNFAEVYYIKYLIDILTSENNFVELLK